MKTPAWFEAGNAAKIRIETCERFGMTIDARDIDIYVDSQLDKIESLLDASGGINTDESVATQEALAAFIEAHS